MGWQRVTTPSRVTRQPRPDYRSSLTMLAALASRMVDQGAVGALETATLPARCGPLVRTQRRPTAHPRKKPKEGMGTDRICHHLLWASDFPVFQLFDCQRARTATGLPARLERPPIPHNRGPTCGPLDRAGNRISARLAVEDVKQEVVRRALEPVHENLIRRTRHGAPLHS